MEKHEASCASGEYVLRTLSAGDVGKEGREKMGSMKEEWNWTRNGVGTASSRLISFGEYNRRKKVRA
jgi:hypothetical protein